MVDNISIHEFGVRITFYFSAIFMPQLLRMNVMHDFSPAENTKQVNMTKILFIVRF